uniref:Uncharacterized protein n=1 Tax=Anopheles atroparvus TaxID=41427 RepID=A0AAG5DV85_ANOAO
PLEETVLHGPLIPREKFVQRGDVGLRHLERFELGQLPVVPERRYHISQPIERIVETVHPPALACIRRKAALFHHLRLDDADRLTAALRRSRRGGAAGAVCRTATGPYRRRRVGIVVWSSAVYQWRRCSRPFAGRGLSNGQWLLQGDGRLSFRVFV